LLREVEILEKGSSSGAGGPVVDSPKLVALKQQNAKLKYQITHLQRVHDRIVYKRFPLFFFFRRKGEQN